MATDANPAGKKTLEIGVVGGGLMGMAVARKLAVMGHQVTVLESAPQVGGLSTWQDYEHFQWDRFYHVILPSDRQLISLLKELGLASELQWKRTYTGFYVDKEMHSISSNMEFLKFPLLSFPSKIRLAWTLLYGSRVDDWRKLERETCASWLLRVSGRNNYDKLWKPLLLAKLGESHSRVSAVFIWSYIKRMFSARDKTASAEQLGHVRGGYKSVFGRMMDQIEAAQGQVLTDVSVKMVSQRADGGLTVDIEGESLAFDKVICTSPANVLRSIVDSELLKISTPEHEIEYLGVICVVVVTRSPVSPFYVVNIADPEIPFTGVIGMSTVVDHQNTGGFHLTYLPRYLLSTSDEFKQDDESVKMQFVSGLKTMFPDFDDADLVEVHVHRAAKVQPLQVLEYSSRVPDIKTLNPDLYVLNTSQFVNATLNNNEVVSAVNKFCETFSPHG